MQIGKRIASLRKNAGLSQDELADKLFVSRELVSKWETDKRNPDYEMIEKIANVFEVSVVELSGGKENIFDELTECFSEDQIISQEKMTEILNSFLDGLSKTERTVLSQDIIIVIAPVRLPICLG